MSSQIVFKILLIMVHGGMMMATIWITLILVLIVAGTHPTNIKGDENA